MVYLCVQCWKGLGFKETHTLGICAPKRCFSCRVYVQPDDVCQVSDDVYKAYLAIMLRRLQAILERAA